MERVRGDGENKDKYVPDVGSEHMHVNHVTVLHGPLNIARKYEAGLKKWNNRSSWCTNQRVPRCVKTHTLTVMLPVT